MDPFALTYVGNTLVCNIASVPSVTSSLSMGRSWYVSVRLIVKGTGLNTTYSVTATGSNTVLNNSAVVNGGATFLYIGVTWQFHEDPSGKQVVIDLSGNGASAVTSSDIDFNTGTDPAYLVA